MVVFLSLGLQLYKYEFGIFGNLISCHLVLMLELCVVLRLFIDGLSSCGVYSRRVCCLFLLFHCWMGHLWTGNVLSQCSWQGTQRIDSYQVLCWHDVGNTYVDKTYPICFIYCTFFWGNNMCFSRWWAILIYTKDISGVCHRFHIALLNDLCNFGS